MWKEMSVLWLIIPGIIFMVLLEIEWYLCIKKHFITGLFIPIIYNALLIILCWDGISIISTFLQVFFIYNPAAVFGLIYIILYVLKLVNLL